MKPASVSELARSLADAVRERRRESDDPPDHQPVPISTIQPESVDWLVPQWIPAGKISIVFGEPGLGKSHFALDLAARITTGRHLPFADPGPVSDSANEPSPPNTHMQMARSASVLTPNTRSPRARPDQGRESAEEHRTPGSVMLFSAEDSVADTVRPRLEAAGADCSRVHVFPNGGHAVLAEPFLLGYLAKMNSVALIVIDPLTAYMAANDFQQDRHMRRMLMPLARVANQIGAAILIVHHASKIGRATALARVAGSVSISAAARSVMMIAPDPYDPEARILAPVKGNLGPAPVPVRFRFAPVQDHSHPRIQWEGPAWDCTANALVQARADSPRAAAQRFIREALGAGPMPSHQLEKLALEEGISLGTFRRARAAVAVSRRIGGAAADGEWLTELNTGR